MAIKFSINNVDILAKQGDRAAIAWTGGRKGTGRPYVTHYPNARIRRNANALLTVLKKAGHVKPLQGPVRLEITIRRPWPQSATKRERSNGDAPMGVRPDWDNLGKQVSDVLQRAGFVKDDGQFADVRVRKMRSDVPGLDVWMEEMECAEVGLFGGCDRA